MLKLNSVQISSIEDIQKAYVEAVVDELLHYGKQQRVKLSYADLHRYILFNKKQLAVLLQKDIHFQASIVTAFKNHNDDIEECLNGCLPAPDFGKP